MVVPFNKNGYGSQKEAFTGASVLAVEPGSALPEVSCQVIELPVGTCSSEIPAKIVFRINKDESWTTFMAAALPSVFDSILGNAVKYRLRIAR